MKEKELREHAICSCCKKPIGHTKIPLFWTSTIVRHGVKFDALRRNAGLAMAMGSPELAQIMGPDEDMTEELIHADITLCETCAMPLLVLIEKCVE
jgi:hypothetical protein